MAGLGLRFNIFIIFRGFDESKKGNHALPFRTSASGKYLIKIHTQFKIIHMQQVQNIPCYRLPLVGGEDLNDRLMGGDMLLRVTMEDNI